MTTPESKAVALFAFLSNRIPDKEPKVVPATEQAESEVFINKESLFNFEASKEILEIPSTTTTSK